MPLTPRQPSSEDPYGLGAFSNKKKAEEPLITKESLLEPKTDPSNKGTKANFFNKLKKSAGVVKEEITTEPKTEPSSKGNKANFFSKLKKSAGAAKEEAPSRSEEANISEFDPSPADNRQSKQQLRDQSSATQTSQADPKTTKLQNNDKPATKPKIIIQINNEEEINALKEELEILELQLQGEEDETAKEEWNKEILRVKQQIQHKSAQDEPSKGTTETAEPESPNDKPNSPVEEIHEKPAVSPKSQSEKLDPTVDTAKEIEGPIGESKPKKKGRIMWSRRFRLAAKQTKEQNQGQQQPVAHRAAKNNLHNNTS